MNETPKPAGPVETENTNPRVEASGTSFNAGTIADKYITRAGEIRRGPGRPRKDGSAPRTAASRPASGNSVAAEPPVNPVDIELVEKCVKAVIQAIDNGVQRACGSRALTVTGDKDFSHELVKTVAMSPEHRELIPALSARIAEKYSLIGRYAPEVMLLCVVGSYGAQVALVFSKLKQFEDRQTAERAKTRTL